MTDQAFPTLQTEYPKWMESLPEEQRPTPEQEKKIKEILANDPSASQILTVAAIKKQSPVRLIAFLEGRKARLARRGTEQVRPGNGQEHPLVQEETRPQPAAKAEPTVAAETQTQKEEEETGFALPDNWWVWLVGGVLAIVVGVWLIFVAPKIRWTVPGYIAGVPAAGIALTMANAALLVTVAASLGEARVRGERLLLDGWIGFLTAVVLAVRRSISGPYWYMFLGIVIMGMGWAVLVNEAEYAGKRQKWYDWIDLTPLASAGGTLILLRWANWKLLPYPDYLPVEATWLVFAASMLKEVSRNIEVGALAIVLGAIAGATMNWVFISLSFAAVTFVTYRAAKSGWIPMTTRKKDTETFQVAGREITQIIPMDTVLAFLYTLAITAMAIRGGDFVLYRF